MDINKKYEWDKQLRDLSSLVESYTKGRESIEKSHYDSPFKKILRANLDNKFIKELQIYPDIEECLNIIEKLSDKPSELNNLIHRLRKQ